VPAGAWGADPPEVNSAGFWLGPGAGSFMAAAAELSTLASAIIAMLGGDQAVAAALGFAWPAPTGDLAVLANVPHLLWQANAAMMLAEHAAKIAETGMAFETLKAATPTPAEVETNQITHGVLQATNFLGINTPAIVANRAQYLGDYWVRSASNKYAYGAASAAGVQAIEPLPPPVMTTMPMGGGDPSQATSQTSAVQAPMQMLMPVFSQLGQLGGQFGQLASGGGPLSSLMSLPQQALQPLMSLTSSSSGLGAVSDSAGALNGASWVGGGASVGGPVSASLGAGGGVGGFGGAGAALAPLRGPVSWPSATVPVSSPSAAPTPAGGGAAVSASTSPAGMGMGGGGAMMAPMAARAGTEQDDRDREQSAAILGSIASFYREPVGVPVITGDAGALIGRGPIAD
jgi:PPE-repeat protein